MSFATFTFIEPSTDTTPTLLLIETESAFEVFHESTTVPAPFREEGVAVKASQGPGASHSASVCAVGRNPETERAAGPVRNTTSSSSFF